MHAVMWIWRFILEMNKYQLFYLITSMNNA